MLIIDRQWSQMVTLSRRRRHASRWINRLQSQRLHSPLLSTFIPLEFGVSDARALRSTLSGLFVFFLSFLECAMHKCSQDASARLSSSVKNQAVEVGEREGE